MKALPGPQQSFVNLANLSTAGRLCSGENLAVTGRFLSGSIYFGKMYLRRLAENTVLL